MNCKECKRREFCRCNTCFSLYFKNDDFDGLHPMCMCNNPKRKIYSSNCKYYKEDWVRTLKMGNRNEVL